MPSKAEHEDPVLVVHVETSPAQHRYFTYCNNSAVKMGSIPSSVVEDVAQLRRNAAEALLEAGLRVQHAHSSLDQ